MDDIHLSAPECIADLYSLFTWIMPKSDYHCFGNYGLSEAFIQDMDISLDLHPMQFRSHGPYISIWFGKGYTRLWYKDIHEYE